MKLQFHTNVREAMIAILNEDVDPIIDYKNTRYMIHTNHYVMGEVLFTAFDKETKLPINDYTNSYRFGAAATFFDAILNVGPRGKVPLITAVYPEATEVEDEVLDDPVLSNVLPTDQINRSNT